jgi:hypothetical protein
LAVKPVAVDSLPPLPADTIPSDSVQDIVNLHENQE